MCLEQTENCFRLNPCGSLTIIWN